MSWKTVLGSQYVIAVFTAIFGFVLAWVLERMKSRDKVRKQLSWDLTVRREAKTSGGKADSRISVSYNGTRVNDLVQAQLTIENTGNTVVKQEELRIRLPERATLLEIGFDPAPEREIGAREMSDVSLSPMERLFKIAHLEVGQKVGYRIVTDGGNWSDWQDLHPFNEQGDVRFLPRDVARAKEDEEEVVPFFISLAGLILLLLIGLAFPAPAALVALAVVVPLGGYFLTKLPKVARVLQRLLAAVNSQNSTQINIQDGRGIQIGDQNIQDNDYQLPQSDPEARG